MSRIEARACGNQYFYLFPTAARSISDSALPLNLLSTLFQCFYPGRPNQLKLYIEAFLLKTISKTIPTLLGIPAHDVHPNDSRGFET